MHSIKLFSIQLYHTLIPHCLEKQMNIELDQMMPPSQKHFIPKLTKLVFFFCGNDPKRILEL